MNKADRVKLKLRLALVGKNSDMWTSITRAFEDQFNPVETNHFENGDDLLISSESDNFSYDAVIIDDRFTDEPGDTLISKLAEQLNRLLIVLLIPPQNIRAVSRYLNAGADHYFIYDAEGHYSEVIAETLPQLVRRKQAYETFKLADEMLRIHEARYKEIKEQLSIAKDLAESASNAKNEFVTNMSHEFRTPMNAIMGMAELLKDTPLNSEQQYYLKTILSSSQNLLAIIGDVLDYSYIESGDLVLEKVDFNVRELVDDAITKFNRQAQEKDLLLVPLMYADIPSRCRGDARRLNQILSNLIENAIKFTHKGEIIVRVRLKSGTDTHAELLFSVTDTGIGIPESQIGNLYQSFYQIDASVTRKYGGTGLGLAISKRLAELMNGEVGLESEEGKGSTFWFTVILELPESEFKDLKFECTPVDFDSVLSEACQHETTGPRILLVEDNIPNQRLAQIILEKGGYRVDIVSNGKEAVSAMENYSYDLILMDIQMPIMDGYEATRIIRNPKSNVTNHEVPIIALTAHAGKKDRDQCFNVGMNDYLSKPFRRDHFLETVKKYIAPSNNQTNSFDSDSFEPSVTLESSRVMNTNVLMENVGGSKQLVNELIRLYLENLPKLMAQIEKGFRDQDLPSIQYSAHALKGMSYNLCAEAVAEEAYKLEQHAKSNNPNEMNLSFKRLKMELKALHAFIDIFKKEMGS